MKYEIELYKNELKTVEVLAESPTDAIKKAKDLNPDFKAECATEILGEDETGKCFAVIAHCEGCERAIFDGENYGSDEEGVNICANCLPSWNSQADARGNNPTDS
jgi:hypothetical protein